MILCKILPFGKIQIKLAKICLTFNSIIVTNYNDNAVEGG